MSGDGRRGGGESARIVGKSKADVVVQTPMHCRLIILSAVVYVPTDTMQPISGNTRAHSFLGSTPAIMSLF